VIRVPGKTSHVVVFICDRQNSSTELTPCHFAGTSIAAGRSTHARTVSDSGCHAELDRGPELPNIEARCDWMMVVEFNRSYYLDWIRPGRKLFESKQRECINLFARQRYCRCQRQQGELVTMLRRRPCLRSHILSIANQLSSINPIDLPPSKKEINGMNWVIGQ
jgi:hypothetical protein